MKLRGGRAIFAALLAVFVVTQVARAGDQDVNITCERKRFEIKHGAGGAQQSDVVSKTEQWGYSVTVENKTFKPLANLEVKYILFYKHEQLGIKGPPRKEHQSGSFTIKSIDALGTQSFDTTPVTLTKSVLIGEPGSYTYFTNGAKPKAGDSLTGLWVRIYKDGNLFAEFANPASLTSTETWE